VVTNNVKVRVEQLLLKRRRFGRLLMDMSTLCCTLWVSVVIDWVSGWFILTTVLYVQWEVQYHLSL